MLHLKTLSTSLFTLALSISSVAAQELIGPRLAVAANFSQGWRPDILKASAQIPVSDFRDTVHWAVVEKADKRFDFRGWRAAFPKILAAQDRDMSLFVNAFHPDYDNGDTAYTAPAVAAFGTYAKKTVMQFGNIRSVEVGNEFNGDDFVRGPAQTQDMDARAAYYVALLSSVYERVKAYDPEIRIVGGGVHSIPVAYLEKIFALGGGAYMDALAIHPYNTPAEHLVRQVAVLRELPEVKELPIEVTEFGTPNRQQAPGFFLRNYCQMALAGVDRAVWYPMHPRGDGFEPVLDDDGNITPIGKAFAYAQKEFAERSVLPFNPDPFTYGCFFGGNKLVVWGEPRDVEIGSSVHVYNMLGEEISPKGLMLSPSDPIVLVGGGASLGNMDFLLSAQQTLADSFHQFDYVQPSVSASNWTNSIEVDGVLRSFQTMPGQERQGVPWTPYLGHEDFADLRLAADYIVPTGSTQRPVSVVQAYVSDQKQSVEIDAIWSVSTASEDGIFVEALLNDQMLFAERKKGDIQIHAHRVDMQSGDVLKFRVGPNQNPWGDYTTHRITLRKTTPSAMPYLKVRSAD